MSRRARLPVRSNCRGRLLAALLAALVGCADPAPPPLEFPDGSQALVDVDVAWMGDDALLLDRRVVVHEGRILAILASDAGDLPTNVEVIAEGGYVMPGLVDLHVHAWFESDLTLFLANGVTTVRNLFGDPLQRGWRDEIAAGDRSGPRIVTAGPIVDGAPPIWDGSAIASTAEEGEEAVVAQAEAGYDLIKVYNRLPEAAWRGVLAEAERRGVQVVGHVPYSVSYTDVAESSQVTIEHMDGLLEELAGFSWWDPRTEAQVRAALESVSPAAVAEIAQALRDGGTWNVPTLVVLASIRSSAETLASRRAAPELAYVHPQIRASWGTTAAATPAELAAWEPLMDAWMGWLKTVHDAGAGVGLGTDCGNAYVIPGYSAHEELGLLVRAGLTPYEALRAGTVDAAAALGTPGESGQVAVGQRADLLWLASNPLVDVANAAAPRGVMVAGEWLSRTELDERLAAIEDLYAR